MIDTINVKLDDRALMPTRAHAWDAGLDLMTPENFLLSGGESITIDTGVHVEIPEGYVGLLKSKSGLNVNHGITSEGTIDAGYTGSIKVKLYNNSHMWYEFQYGDKISQLLIVPIETPVPKLVEEIKGSDRGDDGFGSTGR